MVLYSITRHVTSASRRYSTDVVRITDTPPSMHVTHEIVYTWWGRFSHHGTNDAIPLLHNTAATCIRWFCTGMLRRKICRSLTSHDVSRIPPFPGFLNENKRTLLISLSCTNIDLRLLLYCCSNRSVVLIVFSLVLRWKHRCPGLCFRTPGCEWRS